MKKAFVSMTLMGLLTATGFLASAQQQEREQPQQQQEQQPSEGQSAPDDVFGRLDTDRDGKLSESEFSRAHAGSSEQDVKAQFTDVDADGDGSISKQEFVTKYGSGQ